MTTAKKNSKALSDLLEAGKARNVKASVNKKKKEVTISFSYDQFAEVAELPLSASGRSYSVATSGGFCELDAPELDGVLISLNVCASKSQYDEKLAAKEAKKTAREALSDHEQKQDNLSKLGKLAEMDEAKLQKLLALAEIL